MRWRQGGGRHFEGGPDQPDERWRAAFFRVVACACGVVAQFHDADVVGDPVGCRDPASVFLFAGSGQVSPCGEARGCEARGCEVGAYAAVIW